MAKERYVKVTVTLPASLYEKLKKRRETVGVPVSTQIRKALEK